MLHDFGGVLGRRLDTFFFFFFFLRQKAKPTSAKKDTIGHFLLGSNNFMVMALGSFVKWP